MNYKFNITGGGIFSKYMLAVQNSIYYEIDNIFLNITDDRTDSNMFNNIFKQKDNLDYNIINCQILPSYCSTKKIEESSNLEKYKYLVNKLIFQDEIINRVETYEKKLNICKNTIGVHIRLTDMNIYHKDNYGVSTISNYIEAIKNYNDFNFFIASDNNESLSELKNIFGDKINYIDNLIRCDHSSDDSLFLQLNKFRDKELWIQIFVEMLLLSKCSKLICRTSNVSNASIIHSNTLSQIIRV